MKSDLDQVFQKGIKDSILRVQIYSVLDRLVMLMGDCMPPNTLIESLSPDAFLQLPDSIEPLAICALVSKMKAMDVKVKSVSKEGVDSHFDLMLDLAKWAHRKHTAEEKLQPVCALYTVSPDREKDFSRIKNQGLKQKESECAEATAKFHVAEQRYHQAYEIRFISILCALNDLFRILAPTDSIDEDSLAVFQGVYQNLSPQQQSVFLVFFHQDAYAYIEHIKSLESSQGDHAVLKPWDWLRVFVLSRSKDQQPLELKQTFVIPSSQWGWVDHVDTLQSRYQPQSFMSVQQARSMFSIGSEIIFGVCFLVGCAVLSILEWQALPMLSIACGVIGLIGVLGLGAHLWGARQGDPLAEAIYDEYHSTVNADQMLSGSTVLPPKQLYAEILKQLGESSQYSIRPKVSA